MGKWLKWLAVGAAIFIALSVVVSIIRVAIDSDSSAESEFGVKMGAIVRDVNLGGLEPAKAMVAAQRCATAAECADATRRLHDAFVPYRGVLRDATRDLERLSPSASAVGVHRAYLQGLRLRAEAIEVYIEGIRNNDERKLELGEQLWSQSMEAFGQLIDELEKFLPRR